MGKNSDSGEVEIKEQSFLQRWSRRKRHSNNHYKNGRAASDIPKTRGAQHPAGNGSEEPDMSSANAPHQYRVEQNDQAADAVGLPNDPQPNLPDIDSLTAESDLTSFFSDKVSEELRKKALRKIFSFGKYNFCDGLDDYAEDYTKFEPLGNVLTADLKLKMERDRIKQLADLDKSDQRGDSDIQEQVDQYSHQRIDELAINDKERIASATVAEEDFSKPQNEDSQSTAATTSQPSPAHNRQGRDSRERIRAPKTTRKG